MIARQFKEKRFEEIERYITDKARSSPIPGIYEVELTISGEVFSVYLQTDRKNKVNALCAERHGGGPVTGGAMLAAMLELIAYQAARPGATGG